MNQEQLQAIRERVNKATPGPWYWEPSDWFEDPDLECRYEVQALSGTEINTCIFAKYWDARLEEKEFIAHAREDVPALLDEIERLLGVIQNHHDWFEDGHISDIEYAKKVYESSRHTLAGEST